MTWVKRARNGEAAEQVDAQLPRAEVGVVDRSYGHAAAPPNARTLTPSVGLQRRVLPRRGGGSRYGAEPWERDVPEYEDHFPRAGDWDGDGATHVRRDEKRVCEGAPRTGCRVGWAGAGERDRCGPDRQHTGGISGPPERDRERGVIISAGVVVERADRQGVRPEDCPVERIGDDGEHLDRVGEWFRWVGRWTVVHAVGTRVVGGAPRDEHDYAEGSDSHRGRRGRTDGRSAARS